MFSCKSYTFQILFLLSSRHAQLCIKYITSKHTHSVIICFPGNPRLFRIQQTRLKTLISQHPFIGSSSWEQNYAVCNANPFPNHGSEWLLLAKDKLLLLNLPFCIEDSNCGSMWLRMWLKAAQGGWRQLKVALGIGDLVAQCVSMWLNVVQCGSIWLNLS